jgi:NADPH:quinone reductase-like Zn-dependent oxidoreductase
MRAVRFDRYGGVDELYVAEVEDPGAGPGELVVGVRAAGINPGEASIRKGSLHERWPATFPSGEGSDFAGVVSAVGEGVTAFSAGDEVLGWSDRRSSHAELVAVPEDHVIAKPPALPWEVAGSLFVVGTTAYAAARAVGAGPGDTVVVSAASGGVGSVTVQLCRLRGADVVGIASEANHDWLRSVGVIPVDHAGGPDVLAVRIREAAPRGVHAFIDTFGAEYVRLAVDLGVAPQRIETITAWDAAREIGAKTDGSATAATAGVLREMAALVASGRIEVPIAATYPLDEVRAAYRRLEQRHTRGKIVLVP